MVENKQPCIDPENVMRGENWSLISPLDKKTRSHKIQLATVKCSLRRATILLLVETSVTGLYLVNWPKSCMIAKSLCTRYSFVIRQLFEMLLTLTAATTWDFSCWIHGHHQWLLGKWHQWCVVPQMSHELVDCFSVDPWVSKNGRSSDTIIRSRYNVH